ncbi:MAG: TetR/AcrR family transcriptional regulator [Deltaproteobacteria bacterium]|nr:TetR/AcrR family transcriptional regulator [Deltaproteobacteria bacterium]
MNYKNEKKSSIVEAAAHIFAQRGYSGTSVAEIAVQAGIGKGTIYEYFNSKEDLFFAAFEWYANVTTTGLKVDISLLGGSGAQRLEALNDAVVNLWDEIQDIFALTMEFWAASSSSVMRQRFRDAFKSLYQNLREMVSSLIQNGINQGEFRPDVDAPAVASALVGTWDALFLQAWFDPDFQPLETAQQFLKVVVRGLKQ